MRFLRQTLFGVVLAALSLAMTVYAVHLVVEAVRFNMDREASPSQARERVFAVEVQRAVPDTHIPVLQAFGQVQSRRRLELRAAIGGRVVGLAEEFADGGTVQAGDVLVRIDPADAQAVLDRVGSDLLDAEAEQRDAQRSLVLAQDELQAAQEQAALRDRAFRRQVDLEGRGVATAATVETAELAAASARQALLASRLALANAEARVDQAATNLARARIAEEEAQRDLAETTLRAPFGATLSEVTLVEGRLVSANEKLAMLVDPDALEVSFRISTAQYARLLDADGQLIRAPVRAVLDADGADLVAQGQISRDSAGPGEGQSGRVLFARLDKAPGFKPGDFVSVEVEEPPVAEVALLPASALDSAGTVLALGPDNRLEAIAVTLVRRQGNDVLLRGEGLAGRDIVVGRTPLLGPGIRVRPLQDTGAATPAAEDEMLVLSSERRARLVAFVEASTRMPEEVKAQLLSQLTGDKVPAVLVARIESRMGG